MTKNWCLHIQEKIDCSTSWWVPRPPRLASSLRTVGTGGITPAGRRPGRGTVQTHQALLISTFNQIQADLYSIDIKSLANLAFHRININKLLSQFVEMRHKKGTTTRSAVLTTRTLEGTTPVFSVSPQTGSSPQKESGLLYRERVGGESG